MFPFKKKKKNGQVSQISELRSPYLKKPVIPERALKRKPKKRASLLIPPARLKSPKKSHRLLIIAGALFLIIGVVYVIVFSNFFNLKSWEIEEDGVVLDDTDPINQIIAAEKGKNILFINDQNIIEQVKALHPDIQKINVRKILPQKIRVEFERYPLAANITNYVDKVQKKFIVDTIGFLAEENVENPELPYIKMTTTQALLPQTYALDKDRLEYILNSIDTFQQKFGMKIIDAEYLPREREVHLRTEKNFYIWLDMEKDFLPQLEKLKLAQSKLDIYNTPLEYIDLRISGTDNEKVIYKPRS